MGKEKAEISIFDESFLADLQKMIQKNYAAELLAKIIKDQLVVRMNINPFRYCSLYEALTNVTERYNVKIITAAEIMEELVKIAHELKKQMDEGQKIQLTDQELAFYDLLASKEKFFENYKQIQAISKEIVKELGYYTKVADWNRKEYLKAKLRSAVKNLLINIIDGRGTYMEIEQLSEEIMTHAETVYALQQKQN
jgi:type I restriction enzyme R subunit